MIRRFCLMMVLGWSAAAVRAEGPVRVEILEGPIKAKTWDLAKTLVTDQYDEAAFALPVVSSKYSARGAVLDRSQPFVVRATQSLSLPAGEYRLLLRAKNAARLFLDDKQIADLAFPRPGINGHESVPDLNKHTEPGLRGLAPGQHEHRIALKLDGAAHTFRWEVMIGGLKMRPEPGEPVVALAAPGQPYRLLGESPGNWYSEEGWESYAATAAGRHHSRDTRNRWAVTAAERRYWQQRHDAARVYWSEQPPIPIPTISATMPVQNAIDRFLGQRLSEKKVEPAALVDDDAFLRRVTLDTVGVIPSPAEMSAFRSDPRPERRMAVIDRLLEDPRWADHWMSYWQDVLAENPGLLKPTLNNTGPFRFWIYQALTDNLPMDRFVTDLALMEGSEREGAPAGFAVATQNDVPLAAKAQTLVKAFLAADLTCARCHDAPSRSYKQEQLFGLASLLARQPLAVPETSTVKPVEGARPPAVKVTLKPGTKVEPEWKLTDLVSAEVPRELLRSPDDGRERFALILTGPKNERFAQVMANRLWQRFFGLGLVEPVDDWKRTEPSHPDLLSWLGREFIVHGYDVKHVTRLILNSHAYQRAVRPSADEAEAQLFAGQHRRRLSAEQLLDSLFVAAGKPFRCEELNFDPEGRMPLGQCTNLGVPRRAWQFVSLANERDRPALALPGAQPFVDVLTAYGWRDSRTASQTGRDESPTALQPLVLSNGLLHNRVARLSDDSAFTALCLGDVELPELIRRICQRILSRPPTAEERELFVGLLRDGYEQRKTGKQGLPREFSRSPVSWSNHLSPEATRLKLAEEQVVRAGDPPTPRLTADWRERMEDIVWSLMASSEFTFVP